MQIFKIKENLDYNKLEELRYTYSIMEGSYVSQDMATVISIDRNPYKRQIMQYRADVEDEHMKNIETLRKFDCIEAENLIKEDYRLK